MVRFLFIFLICIPFINAYAAAGCCSHHGGVNGCNTSTNHQSCKDGSSSPTCMCNGSKTTTPAKEKHTTTPANQSTNSNTTATTATGGTAAAATTTNAKTKGCCARHGGVSKCDTASGHQMCKDGTISATCKC